MSIHQLKDGRWIVQYKEKETGKVRREYFGRGPVQEKKAWDRNEELSLRSYSRRLAFQKPSISFRDLTQEYINSRVSYMEPTSFDVLFRKLRKIILPELGSTPVSRLTWHRIDQYVTKRLKKVTRSTVCRDIDDIQAILNWGAHPRRGFILENPIAGYEKPARDDQIIRPPTIDEVRAIIAHSPPHLQRALYLCYYTGLRPGLQELMPLTWDRIDWSGNTILIISAKKNGPRSRVVHIHEDLRERLEGWYSEDRKLDPAPAHIIHYGGRPILRLIKAYNTAKQKAGITRRLPPYSFRHAFVSDLLADAADLKSVSEIVGHSRTDTTQRIYQHTNTDQHRRVIGKRKKL